MHDFPPDTLTSTTLHKGRVIHSPSFNFLLGRKAWRSRLAPATRFAAVAPASRALSIERYLLNGSGSEQAAPGRWKRNRSYGKTARRSHGWSPNGNSG